MVRAGICSVEASTVDVGRDRGVDEILEPLTAAHGTANLRGRNALAHATQQMQRRTVTHSLGQRGQRESGAARHDEFHLAREDVRAAPRRDVEERVGADQEEHPVAAGDGEMPAVDRIERAAEEGDVHGPAWMAASTLAGVKGTDRSRTPIASKTALAMAAGTTAAAGSPAPHGLSVGRSTSSMSTVGISANVRIG